MVILYVDEEESAGAVEQFANQYGLTSAFLMDETGEIGRRYQLRGTPTTYFIDEEGVIQGLQPGFINLTWIEDNLNS